MKSLILLITEICSIKEPVEASGEVCCICKCYVVIRLDKCVPEVSKKSQTQVLNVSARVLSEVSFRVIVVLAPPGAKGVTMSVHLSGTSLYKSINFLSLVSLRGV